MGPAHLASCGYAAGGASDGVDVAVQEQVAIEKPFCRLIRFKRFTDDPKALGVMKSQPKVLADDNQLRQVLLNLIRNAAEAMADQPASERTLTIGSRLLTIGPSEKPGIAVDIIDNGPGIPKAEHRRIFEKFYRLTRTDAPVQPQGTGLGLSMVYHIVRAHDGMTTVESELGQGATFTILLPIVFLPAAPPQ